MKNLTLQQKIEIIEKYNNGKSVLSLSLEYNLKKASLYYFIKNQKETQWRGSRKYTLNENYFDIIDNSNKAYILGFITADGHIIDNSVKRNGGGFVIILSNKDIEILEAIKKELHYNGKIQIFKRQNREYCKLKICSKHIGDVLYSYGLYPNKSYNLDMPKCIPLEFMSHFIRGFSDGDGCIYTSIIDKKDVFRWQATGTEKFISELQKNIENIINIKCYIHSVYTKLNYVPCKIEISTKKNLFVFLDWIYKDAKIYLQRKYEKYQLIQSKQNNIYVPTGKNIRKLSCQDVRDIRYRLSTGETSIQIAKDYDISSASIRKIKSNQSYKDVK